MSDFNSNGSSNVTKTVKYSDLNLSMPLHPQLDDITPLKDIDAVRQAVKNLILTNFYDRPFHPELGSGVTALLFENASIFTAMRIRDEIKRVLEDHEPRVNVIDVDIVDNSDANVYHISIAFNIIHIQRDAEVSFNLQRIR